MVKIALDAMGGDYAPEEIVKGGLMAAHELGVDVVLVGDSEEVKSQLARLGEEDNPRISLVHASQVVGMNESPALALRKKRDSSIMVATSLVKSGACDAVVSCGNTGAQMAAALFVLGRFGDMERPAIATLIPHDGTYTILIDTGANVDVRPAQMVQFARLGKAYAQVVLGIEEPRIGLLSNGQEEHKGNQVTVEAHQLLKEADGIHFVGNIEGRDLFSDAAHVAVCDGFDGNLILKSLEGMALYLGPKLVANAGKGALEVLGEFDFNRIGGAPLLGVNGVSVVCHGASKAEAVVNGIRVAVKCVNDQLVEKIRQVLA